MRRCYPPVGGRHGVEGLIPPQYSGQNASLYLLVELFVIVGTIFLL